MMRWHINALFAVHNNMRGHTGRAMTMGKRRTHSKSIKQKINGKSSAENKIIGSHDSSPELLWTDCFVEAQGWTINAKMCQDNKNAISLENNGQQGSSGNKKQSMPHSIFERLH